MTSPPGANDQPINVTHVVFDFNGGGMETLVAEMGKRFHGTSVRLSLITMSGRPGRLGEATRDRFHQFHVMSPRGGIGFFYPTDVAKVIAQTKADVVHGHTGSWAKAVRGGRLAGVKRILYTEHGREHYDPLRNRVGDRIFSRKTDVVVAVSTRLQHYLHDVIGIAANKLCTVENGVDTKTFVPGPPTPTLRASLDIPPGALVIGSVGRLEPVKAYDRVLEAAARLRGALPPFYVVIGGDGSQREPLQARASELGIADIVRLPGWNPNPRDFYRLFDTFVVSSLSEGQSVSLMEAMACGVACVVTDVGANAEMLGPNLPSQVVRGGDGIVDKLADAIRATLESPEKRDAVAAEVRRRAETCYSLDQMTASYERIYRASDIPRDLVR